MRILSQLLGRRVVELDVGGMGRVKTVEKVPLSENRLWGWALQAVLTAKLRCGPSPHPLACRGVQPWQRACCTDSAAAGGGGECVVTAARPPRRTYGLHQTQRSPHQHRTAQTAGGVVVHCAALLGVGWGTRGLTGAGITSSPAAFRYLPGIAQVPRALQRRWPSEGVSPGRSPDALVVSTRRRLSTWGSVAHLTSPVAHSSLFSLLSCDIVSLVPPRPPLFFVLSRGGKWDYKEDMVFCRHCSSLGQSCRWQEETIDISTQ